MSLVSIFVFPFHNIQKSGPAATGNLPMPTQTQTCTWKGKPLKIPASLTLATCNVYCLASTTLSRHTTGMGKSTVESIT